MPPKYTCSTHQVFPFDEEDKWNSLVKANPQYSVFGSYLWLSTWWKHFGKDFKTHIIKIHDDKNIVGIAPFIKHPICFGKLPILRGITFVDGMATTYRDIIYGGTEQESVCKEIFDYLLSNDKKWDVLSFWNIPEDSPTNPGLIKFCKENNLDIVQPSGVKIPIIKLPKTFEEYLMSLKATVRRNIRNYMRRVLDHEGITYTIINKPTINDIDRFIELHQKLWISRGEPGVFKDRGILEFYREVLLKLAATGEHILFEIQYSGKAIAMCSRFIYREYHALLP